MVSRITDRFELIGCSLGSASSGGLARLLCIGWVFFGLQRGFEASEAHTARVGAEVVARTADRQGRASLPRVLQLALECWF